ncbi:MAG: NusG domain II-containing protein [Pseudomonadota bacterium]
MKGVRGGDLVILLATVALVAGLFALRPGGAGERAEVRVADAVVARLDLDRAGTHVVDGPLGPARLEIADGAIRFMASPCRAQRCVHSGWQRHAGQLAACVPNRMVVRVLGDDRRHDALAF